eukprot:m.152986 g.152986  ORF g.152986 m.152986 type:complete len:396 (+) comp38610_c0_seq4:663-1850(+)
MAEELKAVACEAIDKCVDELRTASHEIWSKPELNFEEHEAHRILTGLLKSKGFDVEEHYTLETAFRARSGAKEGINVAVLCEYDALPEIGHACGHNLIAEAGVAAGIGIQAALRKNPSLGQLTVLGTPAEEGGGGKIKMIKSGCFSDVDVAMMVHPCPYNSLNADFLSVSGVQVTYKGKASHAAAFPWEGVNALDAAVAAYTGISMMRQQMKPTWRAHGIFSNGGAKPNIIPETAQLKYYFRALNDKELATLMEKAVSVFKAAAQATGCQVEFEELMHFSNVLGNPVMLKHYKENATSFGIEFVASEGMPAGSTDMGDVSYVVPSIHPMYSIGSDALNHTRDFTKFSDTDYAHKQTLIFAKAMAMTAIDIFTCPGLMDEIKSAFEKQLKEAKAEK